LARERLAGGPLSNLRNVGVAQAVSSELAETVKSGSQADVDDDALARAIEALRAGDPIVYPTETFYGIGADAFSIDALERIFAIKGRDAAKTIALIAHDEASAFAIAGEVPKLAQRLARAFWPGPLTIVMPARVGIPAALVGPGGGIGVRVSSHPIARALAEGLGHPITATSANLSGAAPARTTGEARATLNDQIKVFVEGGKLPGGMPSTVVQCDRDDWQLLRAGAIDVDQIKAILLVDPVS
jgi:L-threonylcarbamoyladenylate synthase